MTRQLHRLPDTPEPMELFELESGITIAADVWGPSHGRPVVLLHGGGQTRHAWRRAGEQLGASLGGAIALVAVGEQVVDASALVVVDTAPRLEQAGLDGLRRFMTQSNDGYASLDDVADAIAAYSSHPDRPRNLHGLAKNVRLDDAGRYQWHWDPEFMRDDEAPSTLQWEQRRQRLERCARDVSIPTLLVRGIRHLT